MRLYIGLILSILLIVTQALAAPQRWSMSNLEGVQLLSGTQPFGKGATCYVGEGHWATFGPSPTSPAAGPSLNLFRWTKSTGIYKTRTVYTAPTSDHEALGLDFDGQYFVILYSDCSAVSCVFKIAWVDPISGVRVKISSDLNLTTGGPIALHRTFSGDNTDSKSNSPSIIYIVDRTAPFSLQPDKIEKWTYPELNRRSTTSINGNPSRAIYGLAWMGQKLAILNDTTDVIIFVDPHSLGRKVGQISLGGGDQRGLGFDGRVFVIPFAS